MDFKKELIKFLKKHTKLKEPQLEIPPDSKLGDYAFPCYQLSKKYKKSPNDISKDLEKLHLPKFLEKIESSGPTPATSTIFRLILGSRRRFCPSGFFNLMLYFFNSSVERIILKPTLQQVLLLRPCFFRKPRLCRRY